MEKKEIKKFIREHYAAIAKCERSCCSPVDTCCGNNEIAQDISKNIGYSDEELKAIPKGSNLGLGCGNPVALASLNEGETVLDLGSGAGLDCFLAAKKVGRMGQVIGVDMTPDMVEKARENARKENYSNVEFRLGEIENLPAADNSVDVVISNCVINLSIDKARVFREAFRVLKPGGRLMISDIVLLKELPEFLRENVEAYVSCLSGAIMKDKYLQQIEKAGFQNIEIINESYFPINFMTNDPIVKEFIENLNMLLEDVKEAANSVISIKVRGIKSK